MSFKFLFTVYLAARALICFQSVSVQSEAFILSNIAATATAATVAVVFFSF